MLLNMILMESGPMSGICELSLSVLVELWFILYKLHVNTLEI